VGMCQCKQMFLDNTHLLCIKYACIREEYNTIQYCIVLLFVHMYGSIFGLLMAIQYIGETRSWVTATCFGCLDCLTFRGPCIVIYSYNKTNERH